MTHQQWPTLLKCLRLKGLICLKILWSWRIVGVSTITTIHHSSPFGLCGNLIVLPTFSLTRSCQFDVMVLICLWWGWRQTCGFCNLIISEQLPVRFHRCTNAICLCLWKLHIGIICMAFYQCAARLYLCSERVCVCVKGEDVATVRAFAGIEILLWPFMYSKMLGKRCFWFSVHVLGLYACEFYVNYVCCWLVSWFIRQLVHI